MLQWNYAASTIISGFHFPHFCQSCTGCKIKGGFKSTADNHSLYNNDRESQNFRQGQPNMPAEVLWCSKMTSSNPRSANEDLSDKTFMFWFEKTEKHTHTCTRAPCLLS